MRLAPRTIDRLATTGGALLVLAALLQALRWAAVEPFRPPRNVSAASRTATQPLPRAELNMAAIWQRDLRQSLVEQPPAAARPEALPSIQLLGTAIEPQRRFGVFNVANRSVIKEVGAEIEGYRIVGIDRGLARLQRADKNIELRVPWYDKLVRTLDPSER